MTLTIRSASAAEPRTVAEIYPLTSASTWPRGFHRAFAGIALPNDASIALHRRFGFELVGVYNEVCRKFDRWLDVAGGSVR
jgi:phosphinothricin acetyltransferase